MIGGMVAVNLVAREHCPHMNLSSVARGLGRILARLPDALYACMSCREFDAAVAVMSCVVLSSATELYHSVGGPV